MVNFIFLIGNHPIFTSMRKLPLRFATIWRKSLFASCSLWKQKSPFPHPLLVGLSHESRLNSVGESPRQSPPQAAARPLQEEGPYQGLPPPSILHKPKPSLATCVLLSHLLLAHIPQQLCHLPSYSVLAICEFLPKQDRHLGWVVGMYVFIICYTGQISKTKDVPWVVCLLSRCLQYVPYVPLTLAICATHTRILVEPECTPSFNPSTKQLSFCSFLDWLKFSSKVVCKILFFRDRGNILFIT